MRRSSSLLTSGRRRTPRTRLKIAALAPMPSASVSTTVIARPLLRASERAANFTSFTKVRMASRDGESFIGLSLIWVTSLLCFCCHEGCKAFQTLGPPLLHPSNVRRGQRGHLYNARAHNLFRFATLL